MGVFSPMVLFGHTWDVDESDKCIRALMEKKLFLSYFKTHVDAKHTNTEHTYPSILSPPVFGNDLISLVISIHDTKKQYLKLSYQMQLMSGEFILSNPLSDKENDTLNRYNTLISQYQYANVPINVNTPIEIINLQSRSKDIITQSHYTIVIPGIDDKHIVRQLFNYLFKSLM